MALAAGHPRASSSTIRPDAQLVSSSGREGDDIAVLSAISQPSTVSQQAPSTTMWNGMAPAGLREVCAGADYVVDVDPPTA